MTQLPFYIIGVLALIIVGQYFYAQRISSDRDKYKIALGAAEGMGMQQSAHAKEEDKRTQRIKVDIDEKLKIKLSHINAAARKLSASNTDNGGLSESTTVSTRRFEELQAQYNELSHTHQVLKAEMSAIREWYDRVK
jgi:hypothetical protein